MESTISMPTSKPDEVLLLCASMSTIFTAMPLLSILPEVVPSPDDVLFLPPGLVLTAGAPSATALPRKLVTTLPQLFTSHDIEMAYLLTTACRWCPGGVESRAGEYLRKLSVSLSKLSRMLFLPSSPASPRQSSTAMARMQALLRSHSVAYSSTSASVDLTSGQGPRGSRTAEMRMLTRDDSALSVGTQLESALWGGLSHTVAMTPAQVDATLLGVEADQSRAEEIFGSERMSAATSWLPSTASLRNATASAAPGPAPPSPRDPFTPETRTLTSTRSATLTPPALMTPLMTSQAPSTTSDPRM
mmetsp:Transcript_28634/g.57288  ORF Transcript_28634/g.57288 Transcript_28634/m.57288 type:complete len:303 (-) Transcript_28634:1034-1942(-)